MQAYKIGQSYTGLFVVNDSSGNLVNADSLPTATAYLNGVSSAGFTLTVENITTGLYKVTGTVPATYVSEDRVQVFVAATVSGGSKGGIISDFKIVSASFSDVADALLGKWVLDPMTNTLTLYKSDGVTVLETFDMAALGGTVPAYTVRTPR